MLIFLVAGCALTPEEQPPSKMVKRSQLLMGTLVQVTAVGPNDRVAAHAASAGLAEIRRLELLLSTWIPTSELSQVNAGAGLNPVAVSPDTFTVVMCAFEIARLTGGAFNIAIGPAVDAWSVMHEPRIPDDAELLRLRPLLRTRQWLRCNGLGRQPEWLLCPGISRHSVSCRMGSRLPLGIRHPREDGTLLASVELRDEAISTAGDYERFFEKDGVIYHHILDPATLWPAQNCQSVTVLARHGVMADGLDTGIFVLGPARGMELVERLPDVEALIVDRNGKVWISSGLKGRVHMEPRSLKDSSEWSASMPVR